MRLRLFFVLILVTLGAFSQERETNDYLAIDYHYGSILKHNKTVTDLIHAHPAGLMLSYNVRTTGAKRWEQEYNYPDWGVSMLYQDFNYGVLGKNYSVGFHYNFYFLNRNLQLRIGEGINYNTMPFDIETNFKNVAYGSHLTGFTQIGLQYVKPKLVGNLGLRAGVLLLHHSNGGVKSPNTGTNVFSTSVGLTYDFSDQPVEIKERVEYEKYTEPLRFNLVVRGGINESDYIGLGQHPFFVLSTFVDKRLSYKHSIQLGVDVIASEFLKRHIEYTALAFPDRDIDPDVDYKRVGVFLGHEFRMNKIGIPTQLAYYVYNPSGYENVPYVRAGVKYYMSEKWFAVGTVRAHGFNAETIELGLGIRL
ncbi:hypothetical protein SCB49_09035 [unidentified eubacterium SCB49]|nr:hypothetical protein SCB49_09035 [unidentified eubacterium SCB49]